MTQPTSRIEEYLAARPAPKAHVHSKLGPALTPGAPALTGGEGSLLVDDAGNTYLDLVAGSGTCFLGRNNPRITAACRDLLEMDLPNLSIVNASILGGVVAGELLGLTNGQMNKVIYANSGTESTDVMIRFARVITKRRRFLYLEGGFHGRSFGAVSLAGFPELREGQAPFMPECTAIPVNDLRALRRELKQGDVAGFIYEPVQRLTGVELDRGYLREAEILCRQAEVLLLADESHTGLGRTGHWFHSIGLGIRPDMMSVSSTLSGGAVPVAAVMMTDPVYDTVYTGLTSGPIYFSTFAENNLAMTAALVTLEQLAEIDAPAMAQQVSATLREGLTELQGRGAKIRHIGGAGLMLTVHFDDELSAEDVQRKLLADHRVIVNLAGPGTNAISLTPAVTLGADEQVRFIQAMGAALGV